MRGSGDRSVHISFRARPDRERVEALESQRRAIADAFFSAELLDLTSTAIVVLNRHRQVVFVNDAARRLLDLDTRSHGAGLSSDALLPCAVHPDARSGCGGDRTCRSCEFVNAVLAGAMGDRPVVREGTLRSAGGSPSDVRITGTPLAMGTERFVLAELVDVSDEHHRTALERAFFHDLLNVASGIHGLLQTIDIADPDDLGATLDIIRSSTAQLINEIETQRVIAYAERGHLDTTFEDGGVIDTLTAAGDAIRAMAQERRTDLQMVVDPPDLEVTTDHTLLRRVLINLLKNAIEANDPDDVVRVHASSTGGGVRIEIHNDAHIPDTARVFRRSFTTKGAGRGLGTFSAKLITEGYLGGTIGYVSHPERGTTFTVDLPSR